MTRLFLALLFSASLVYGEGPKFKHQDTFVQQEYENVYKDLRSVLTTNGSSKCIDDPTLCVDTENNRVGLGTSTPTGRLDIVGTSGRVFKVVDDGYVTQPLQPCFLVRNAAGQSDLTGNTVNGTVTWDTEVFDQGADFASNTFTAPVTGRYLFVVSFLLSGITSAHTSYAVGTITTSNRSYYLRREANAYAAGDSGGLLHVWGSAICDMDAGDTATVNIVVAASTQVIDIYNDQIYNSFSGSLFN